MGKKLFKKNKKILLCLMFLFILLGTISASVIHYQNENRLNAVEKKDNGFTSLKGSDNAEFDKEMTPVTNMLITLKILNGSAQCDSAWYQEVADLITMLRAQYRCYENSEDEVIKQMMILQSTLANKLEKMSRNVCEEEIREVQEAYNAYHDYYYSIYGEGVILNE